MPSRLARFGAVVIALLFAVALVHHLATVGSADAGAGEVQEPVNGFEVLSITGTSPIGADLLKRFALSSLAPAQVDASYGIDIAVLVGQFDDATETVVVTIIWYVRRNPGEILGTFRQDARVPVSDLNDKPELIWPAAARAAAPSVINIVRLWTQKTRS